MYRALKTAQIDMNECLLKLTDEIVQAVKDNSPVAATTPKDAPGSQACESCECLPQVNALSSSLQMMHMKQDGQFRALTNALENLSKSMSTIVSYMKAQTQEPIHTASTIPSLQPSSSPVDMVPPYPAKVSVPAAKVAAHSVLPATGLDEEVSAIDEEVEMEEVEEEEVEEEEVEEEEVEMEEEVEEELEVEEWTYKGQMYFKDQHNTVYANDDGEVGDAVGSYDPIKKVLKKLPPS
jgi:hypothetical protein